MMMISNTLLFRSSLNRTFHAPRISTLFLSTLTDVEAIFDAQRLEQWLETLAPTMASSLASVGYWTNDQQQELVTPEEVHAMRLQSIALRNQGRFQQSMSETTTSTGEIRAFPKPGVFACEPDGQDYETAPDLLIYMSTLINVLPPLLNQAYRHITDDKTLTLTQELSLSNQAFNAKLAVTSPGGSVYPLHVDNTLGIRGSTQDDARKLTFILYLNDEKYVDGGELRLVLGEHEICDIPPVGGRVVVFWSDEIPHEVLPCAPHVAKENADYDRYALTVWIPETDPRNVQPPGSKFSQLRQLVF